MIVYHVYIPNGLYAAHAPKVDLIAYLASDHDASDTDNCSC